MKTILYLTDLYYQAKGRKYYEEDLFITSKLKDHFNLLIGHPQQAIQNLNAADLVVFRNTGPVIAYPAYFDLFIETVIERNVQTFNSFDGKADMKGKQYLPDLWASGFPVIPTVEKTEDLDRLGNPEKYLVKIKNGADSIGMEILTREELLRKKPEEKLIQPFVDFESEVSFYYLNNEFQYALYAPDKNTRWDLLPYQPSSADLDFADSFIRWNDMKQGITRVDACRLKDGSLLLVELEDLNPFLSLDRLDEGNREEFINNLIHALQKASG